MHQNVIENEMNIDEVIQGSNNLKKQIPQTQLNNNSSNNNDIRQSIENDYDEYMINGKNVNSSYPYLDEQQQDLKKNHPGSANAQYKSQLNKQQSSPGNYPRKANPGIKLRRDVQSSLEYQVPNGQLSKNPSGQFEGSPLQLPSPSNGVQKQNQQRAFEASPQKSKAMLQQIQQVYPNSKKINSGNNSNGNIIPMNGGGHNNMKNYRMNSPNVSKDEQANNSNNYELDRRQSPLMHQRHKALQIQRENPSFLQQNNRVFEKPPLPLEIKRSKEFVGRSNESNIFQKHGEDLLKQKQLMLAHASGGKNGLANHPNLSMALQARDNENLSGRSGSGQNKRILSAKGFIKNSVDEKSGGSKVNELYNRYVAFNREPSELSKINERLSHHLYN